MYTHRYRYIHVLKHYIFILLIDMAATNNLARRVNHHRRILRPADPQTLNFIIDPNHIEEGFIKGDIWVEQKCHIILASDYQMELLTNSTHWYILLLIVIVLVRLFYTNIKLTYVACRFVDGTFKIVKAPFTQLWSIHAFVRHGTVAKQIPLVFILMSARRRVSMIISYCVCTIMYTAQKVY